jgi:hypothetical protein
MKEEKSIFIRLDKQIKFKFQTACLINDEKMSDVLNRSIIQYIKETENTHKAQE